MRKPLSLWLGVALGLLIACGGGGSTPNGVAPPVLLLSEGQVLPSYPLIRTAGKGAGTPLPLVPLEGRLEDLATFLRVACSIQFFHPSDGVADTNWDEFLQYGSHVVASRPASQGLAACLGELFGPMAPQVRFGGIRADEPEGSLLAAWIRMGYRDREEASSLYLAERRLVARGKLSQALRGPRTTLADFTVNGLRVSMPLVQAWDGQRTLPLSQGFRVPPSVFLSNRPEDPYLGLALAGKTWAVLQAFFPYFGVLDVEWDKELMPLLKACTESSNRAAALDRALRLALTKLQDSHMAMPSLPVPEAKAYLPVILDWIEGRVIVLHSRVPGIPRGWEVLRMDGVPILEVVEAGRVTSLTNERHSHSEVLFGFDGLSCQPRNRSVTLELKDGAGRIQTVALQADQDKEVAWEAYRFREFAQYPLTRWLEPGLLYANLSDVKASDLPALKAEINKATGVVFDLRRYPQVWSSELFARWTPKTLYSLPMRHLFAVGPDEAPRFVESPQSQPGIGDLSIPVLLLCSKFSQSMNEHMLGYAQSAGLKIMGEPTSGANGNITHLYFSQLPGFSITFTGMEIRQHDLSRFHGVGLLPDLLRPRTVESIRKGNDEVLEAAQAWVRERMPK